MADTKQQLTEIIEAYNIGKKPLSTLLGWGVTTVMNQLKADNASPEFASKINEIHENPYAFARLLEENKRLITDVAYRKAKAAVEKRILRDKSALLVMYLARHSNFDIAPYQLTAALFYSQALSLLINGRPLFDDDVYYLHRSFIPYPSIYSGLIKNGVKYVRTETDALTNEEKDLVSGVNKVLCGYSPNAIRAVLKADRARLVERHGGEDEETDGVLITLNELQSFFAENSALTPLNDPKDLKRYFELKLAKKKPGGN